MTYDAIKNAIRSNDPTMLRNVVKSPVVNHMRGDNKRRTLARIRNHMTIALCNAVKSAKTIKAAEELRESPDLVYANADGVLTAISVKVDKLRAGAKALKRKITESKN